MKVSIIGGGGRERALAWKCAQSNRVTHVYVAPGNAGTAREPGMRNVDVAADDIPGLLSFALAEKIDLTIVGPEGALVLGVTDEFGAAGLRCFGPSRAAAQLESSKDFSKAFMKRHGIPTAAYATFSDANEAHAYIEPARDVLLEAGKTVLAGLILGVAAMLAPYAPVAAGDDEEHRREREHRDDHADEEAADDDGGERALDLGARARRRAACARPRPESATGASSPPSTPAPTATPLR